MKKINTKSILIFLITLLISIITYINFFPEYYSIDTPKIIKDGYMKYGIQYSLYDGRIFMFIILGVFNILNISFKNLVQIFLIFGLIISSLSVLKLYNIITICKPASNKKCSILIYLIAYCFVLNFMYIDCMEFIEVIIISSSILFYIKSTEEIILKNHSLKGLLYCVIGVLFYQGTINLFVTMIILFLIIDKEKDLKTIIKQIVLSIGIFILAMIVDVLIIYIIRLFVETTQVPRLKWNMIDNLIKLKEYIPNLIIDSVRLFPQYLQLILIAATTAIICVKNLNEKNILKLTLPIIFVIVCYFGSMALCILTPEMLTSINGRMFMPTGIIISALLMYAYIKLDIFENKILRKLIQIIIILYFVINIMNTIDVTAKLREGNNIDREISYEIQSVIERYEEETNIEIKKIAITYSNDLKNDKEWLRSKKMLRAYNALIYEAYTGEELEDANFEMSIRAKYFPKVEKSIKCVGDTVYVYM